MGRAALAIDSATPALGYRHLWAMLRGQTPHRVNKKAVY